jgi:hypothetical protein
VPSRHRFLVLRSLAAVSGAAALLASVGWRQLREPRVQLGSMAQLLERYALGEFEVVANAMATAQVADPAVVLAEFQAGGERWTARGESSDVRRGRRLVAASLALEAAGAPFYIAAAGVDQKPQRVAVSEYRGRMVAGQRDLVAWAVRQLYEIRTPTLALSPAVKAGEAPTPLDVAELRWLLAVVALVQGDPDFLIGPARGDVSLSRSLDGPRPTGPPLLMLARQRFPDEPRFKLAGTFAEERRTTILNQANVMAISTATPEDGVIPTALLEGRMDPGAVQAPRITLDARTYGAGLIDGIGASYEALTSEPEVRPEALVRFGYHLIRVSERQRAVAAFSEAVKAPADPMLQYLSYFFRGWVLHRQGDRDAAERDYREALRLSPASRQVKTLLAGILAERGERAEAREVLGDALQMSIPLDDPWTTFHQGEYRFWPERMVALRGALK